MGISYLHSHGGGNVDAMAQQRRLGSLWSFLRQQDVGESIAAGNGSSDLLRIFSMSTCDDTNSNVIFSAPGSKKAEVLGDSDVGMVTSFSNIDSQIQLALSSWTCPAWTTTCSCSRTPPTAESTPSVAAPLTSLLSLLLVLVLLSSQAMLCGSGGQPRLAWTLQSAESCCSCR
uniref:Uncharacterized protein n=1 Tax=Triticum urartu TaxID=4572 RepID=A0A8R7NZZ2_TRIUA